jgi:hypothetical protein
MNWISSGAKVKIKVSLFVPHHYQKRIKVKLICLKLWLDVKVSALAFWVGFRVIMAIMKRISPYYKKLNPSYPDCRQSLSSGGIARVKEQYWLCSVYENNLSAWGKAKKVLTTLLGSESWPWNNLWKLFLS